MISALCDSLGDRMNYDVSLEIGKKYTDASFVDDMGRIEDVKIVTIPSNLMMGLSKCIEEGAAQYGLAKAENLINCSRSIKLSIPTVGPDALTQKTKRPFRWKSTIFALTYTENNSPDIAQPFVREGRKASGL